jgi:hypothetical protein
MKYGNRQVKTYAELHGEEVECVAHVFVQPREDDTNTAAGIELENVIFGERDIIPEMCERAIEQLEMRLYEEIFGE